jgi:hypothetical protein
MFRKALVAGAVCAACTSTLFADFTYEQSSKITGGMMAGMMKFAGAFSKQAREPMNSTVMVKGDRMAMINKDRISVIDVGKETFTDIDLQKKTYAVITFADMMRAMQKASEKVKTGDADMSFKADVKNTGATKQISGFDAKQTILTLTMEGTDKKSGNKGAMVVTTDMWLAPSMAGYGEVRDFYMKMAQKMSWSPNSGIFGALAAQQPGMSKGMAEVYKEMSKLDGVPVLQIVRMSGAGEGMPSDADLAAAQQQQQQQQEQPAPTASEAAGTAAAGRTGRLGAIAGGLGGFGGFGRKKKQAEEQQQQQAPQQTQSQPATAAAPGTLIELTTEMTSFSAAPVDASKFDVPAGFKQVEHDMQKALK